MTSGPVYAEIGHTIECMCLFHRRNFYAFYVYNGCLAWYNVVLTHGSTQA